MSRPSEPVETVSISIDLSFLPSFMIEPLPNARSIWVSAASRAFDLSMELLSTTRSAAGLMITLHMAKDSGADKQAHLGRLPPLESTEDRSVHSLFSVRNMFFWGGRVLVPFRRF